MATKTSKKAGKLDIGTGPTLDVAATIVSSVPVVGLERIPEIVSVPEYPSRVVAWDDKVILAPVKNFRGVDIPGRKGVFTEDGILLGSYAADEHLLENSALLSYFEGALREMGLEWERTIFCLAGGAEMVAHYVIRSITVNGPDGKPICLRISIENSYNGTRKVALAIQALRLICLNGMVGLRNVFSLAQRHSGSMDSKGIICRLTPEIETGMKGISASLNKLADTKISDDEGRFFLRNLALANKLKFSPLLARRIETLAWNRPAEDEKDTRNTLFGVFNSTTRYASRRLENADKMDVNERSITYANMAIVKAADEPETFKRLVKPISWEQAYGVKEAPEEERL